MSHPSGEVEHSHSSKQQHLKTDLPTSTGIWKQKGIGVAHLALACRHAHRAPFFFSPWRASWEIYPNLSSRGGKKLNINQGFPIYNYVGMGLAYIDIGSQSSTPWSQTSCPKEGNWGGGIHLESNHLGAISTTRHLGSFGSLFYVWDRV